MSLIGSYRGSASECCEGSPRGISDVFKMEVPPLFIQKVQAVLAEMQLEIVKNDADLFVIKNSRSIGRFTVHPKIRDLKDPDWKAKIFPIRDDQRNLQIIFVKSSKPIERVQITVVRSSQLPAIPLQKAPPTFFKGLSQCYGDKLP